MYRLRQLVCLGVALLVICLIASPQIARAATSVDKTDTVYAETDATGTARDVRVQSLLANDGHASELLDRTNLTDIEADDDQTFEEQSDGTILWSADGEQVSYEGSSQDDLPVGIDVTYTLDGKEVDASALAGASGHLVIRIDYRNDSTSLQSVGGTQESVATPFVCLSILTLDSDVASNVVVTNGSVVEDKGGMAVVGYAVPGLRESLVPDGAPESLDDVDFPEYVEVEADVTDFSLDGIHTIVTAEPFANLDLDGLRSDGGIDGADELEEVAGQLVSGSDELAGALWQLAGASAEVQGGAEALRQALGTAQSGIGELARGGRSLEDGLEEASSLAGSLVQTASATSEAASQLPSTLGGAQDSISAATGTVSGLRDALASLDATGADAAQAASSAQGAVDTASTAVQSMTSVASELDPVQKSLETILGDSTLTLTEDQRAALQDLSKAIGDLGGSELQEELQGASSTLATASQQLGADADKLGAPQDVSGAVSQSEAALESLGSASDAVAAASEAASGVRQGSEMVFAQASGLAEGLSSASSGASGLAQSLGTLDAQVPQALEGFDALTSGIAGISQATAATAEGADALRAGLSAFDEEGISRVVQALEDLDDDLSGIADRLDALQSAAKAYDTFSGKADGQTGTVRFVYQTDGIG